MDITPEQAKQELARRELAKRAVGSEPNNQPGAAYVNAQGQSEVNAEPIPEADRLQTAKNEWLQGEINAGRIKAVEPSFWEKLRAQIPATGGSIAGAIATERMSRPMQESVANPWAKGAIKVGSAAAGAFLGGFGGEAGHQLYIRSEKGAQPATVEDMFHESVKAGETQAIGEVTGRGIAKVGSKILAPFANKLKPEAIALWGIMKKYGVHPTPAQATESRIVDTMEGMAEKALFTTDDLQRLKTVSEPAAFERYIDDVAKQIGKGIKGDMETAGNILDATLTNKREVFDAAVKAKYKTIDNYGVPGFAKKVGDTIEVHIVDNEPIRKMAKKIYDKAALNVKLGESNGIMQLAKKAMELPDADSFSQAISARSSLLKEVSEIEGSGAMRSPKPEVERAAKTLAIIADKQMEKAARRIKLQFPDKAGEFETIWRAANQFKREGEEIFHKKIVKVLARDLAETPGMAVTKVFRDPTQTREIFKLVDEPTKVALRSAFFEQMLNDARSIDNVVAGKTLKRIITDNKTRSVMKEAFSPSHLKDIDNIVDWGIMTQSATGGGGGMLIQLTQGGAIMGLLSTPYKKTSLSLLIAPPVMSKLMASRMGAYWLSRGIKLPAKSPEVAAIATKIANMVYESEQLKNIGN
jgi:hypothetical protein